MVDQEDFVRRCPLRVLGRFLVRDLRVSIVYGVLVNGNRLAAAGAYACVARTVIVPCHLVLMVEVDLADLHNVPRSLVLTFNVFAGRHAATANDGRLIAIGTRRPRLTRHPRCLSLGAKTGAFDDVFRR